ncbi:MAG: EscU/YscU/HrcU family type III secretion system export apparatus switch protein [Mycobacterium leprae]
MADPKREHRKTAVALGYEPESGSAPRVLAAGQGELAEALLALAAKHHVPVQTNGPLAEALVKLQIGREIPPELYAAVAEVLAFLWRQEARQASAGRAVP